MSKKIRYLLIALGFIFFLMAAPLIVLYVRGITYDFSRGKFVQTGIFSISAQPKDVDIFLDGKLKRHGSGDIKFVAPGEHLLVLQKQGYQSWGKRLNLNPGQVTWANTFNNKVYLFYNQPKNQTLAEGVLDFYNQNSFILYLANNAVITSQTLSLTQATAYTMPKPVNKILASDGGNNFIFTDSSSSAPVTLLMFNSASGNFTDLSPLFNSTPSFQFSGGDLYALSQNILYKINAADQTKTPVLEAVKAFYFQAGSLYYISQNAGVYSLIVSQNPFSQSQTLVSNIQPFSQGSLFVTFEKQIFLLADGSLYRANSSMENLADNVTQTNFNSNQTPVTVFHSGEFDYYDPYGQDLTFVTRSEQELNNLTVKNNIGYGFFLKDNQLEAIELDTRDSQNQYVLYKGENVTGFSIDSSGQNVLILDNGELKSLLIR